MAKAKEIRSEYVDRKVITQTAKLDRAIKVRQQEEKKAFIDSELAKEKAQIREYRTAGIRNVVSSLKGFKSKMPKTPKVKGRGIYNQDRGVSLGGSGPQFGLDKKNKNPFDIKVKN